MAGKNLEADMKKLIKRTDDFISSGIKARQKYEKEIQKLREEIGIIKKELIFERSRIESLGTEHLEKRFVEMNEIMTDFLRKGTEIREGVKRLEETMALRSDFQNLLLRVQQLEAKASKSNMGHILERINEVERKIVLLRSATPYVIE